MIFRKYPHFTLARTIRHYLKHGCGYDVDSLRDLHPPDRLVIGLEVLSSTVAGLLLACLVFSSPCTDAMPTVRKQLVGRGVLGAEYVLTNPPG
jgi:hypothetical protein